MEGVILIFLCLTMLLGSFIAGMLPLTLNLSESKMRHITILGAGLLIGTALAVIVPEGIHTLYANQKCVSSHAHESGDHHLHKRDLSWMNANPNPYNNNFNRQQQQQLDRQHDIEAVNLFLKQISRDKNLNVRSPSWTTNNNNNYYYYNYPVNIQRMRTNLAQQQRTNQQHDQEAMRLFMAQLSRDKNLSARSLVKRIAQSNELTDEQKIAMFLASLNGQRVIPLDEAMEALRRSNLSGRDLLELVADRLDEMPAAPDNNNNTDQVDDESTTAGRSKRDLDEQQQKKDAKSFSKDIAQVGGSSGKEAMIAGGAKEDVKIEDAHVIEGGGGGGQTSSHSAIGVTLVLGFVFMLFIDQIGGKIGHRHQTLDSQSIRNKITFSTTLGLIVHAAADGIALGAAAATSKTDVEMIVFLAIMLHKAPAAFGLVSFLIHEGLDRARVRKHLAVFALAAPIMAIITFVVLESGSNVMVTSDSTGLCMLFSAGTFLYVSTVHVLPEVQAHNEDRQFRFAETMSFVVGAVIPLFLTVGHGH